MNRLLFFIAVIFVTSALFYYVRYEKAAKAVVLLNNEIEISRQYLNDLNEELAELRAKKAIRPKVKKSKDEELKDILTQFMKDKNIGLKPSGVKLSEMLEKSARKKTVEDFVPDHMPINGLYMLSQKYSTKHRGTDYAANEGTEVVAAGAGVVDKVLNDKYFGNLVIIDHQNGYATLYAHMSVVFITPRTFVDKAEAIGLVGNTGNSSSPHLHVEVVYAGTHIDPDSLFMAAKKLTVGTR